jgi:hypothetical protein
MKVSRLKVKWFTWTVRDSTVHAGRTTAVLVALALAGCASAAAEPATLALACKGTKTSWLNRAEQAEWQNPEPHSGGLLIDLRKETMDGFLGRMTEVVISDTTIYFDKSDTFTWVNGSIDRITGGVTGFDVLKGNAGQPALGGYNFDLKCTPT